MKPDYKNWVPAGMRKTFVAVSIALLVVLVVFLVVVPLPSPVANAVLDVVLLVALLVCAWFARWCVVATRLFDLKADSSLGRRIVDGTAAYVDLPEGGTCLDVGCGSGALSIAVAKRNPGARVLGVDRWGKEYASFSKRLCENNAQAEGVTNVSFAQGDACKLDFPDETFDAVCSNYVYHNIVGANKQELLLETLRTLKKGGTFAIHDLMSPQRYGDMDAFVQRLRDAGYAEARLVPTGGGKFMSDSDEKKYMLQGSTLLVGRR